MGCRRAAGGPPASKRGRAPASPAMRLLSSWLATAFLTAPHACSCSSASSGKTSAARGTCETWRQEEGVGPRATSSHARLYARHLASTRCAHRAEWAACTRRAAHCLRAAKARPQDARAHPARRGAAAGRRRLRCASWQSGCEQLAPRARRTRAWRFARGWHPVARPPLPLLAPPAVLSSQAHLLVTNWHAACSPPPAGAPRRHVPRPRLRQQCVLCAYECVHACAHGCVCVRACVCVCVCVCTGVWVSVLVCADLRV